MEKQKRQLNDELENLRDSLEESETTGAAQQEIRAQRENELAHLKRTLEEETAAHEATITSMRQKHTKAIEDLNNQLESSRKVHSRQENVVEIRSTVNHLSLSLSLSLSSRKAQ